MRESSVSTRAAAPSSLMKKTPEEAPFNPQGLTLMPALALVKGETSQHGESIGSREAVCWLPTQRPTEKGKQSFSANSNKDEAFAREAFSFVLHHYITRHFSHSTPQSRRNIETLVLIIYFQWLSQLNFKGVLFICRVQIPLLKIVAVFGSLKLSSFTLNADVLFKRKGLDSGLPRACIFFHSFPDRV